MARRPKPTPPAAWIRPGALADFRMVSGAPVTHAARRVLSEPWQLGSGDWVVKIEGVSGGVSCEPRFLTPAKVPAVEVAVEVAGVALSVCRYSITIGGRHWEGDTVEGFARDLAESGKAVRHG
jgi:hypothetical protein